MMKTQVGIRRYRFAAVAAFSVIFATPVLAQDTTDDLAAAAKRAAPGTQVVDSKGKVVGTLLGGDTVERQVNGGLWVSFGATPSGIAISLTPATFTPGGWTSANCSGVPYMVAAGLPTEAIPVAATTGYS